MRFAEDYPVGSSFELGSHIVTAEEITRFATQYDPQPYHLSEAEGQQSAFGGLIASGWNTAAIWMSLYVRAMLEDSSVEGSPGVDELRWLTPVRPGDELFGHVEVAGMVPSLTRRDVLTLRKKGWLTRGDGETVMSLVLHSRFTRRPSAN
ncbi:acyl dehydratase [Solihabitans fulvus]|uniref:Acyl dehydratase n=1 Tax=Solihabitans fulvus TaxID=1892852 RepID=A0A5B2XDP8_9PSEU|nr:MaoC/PaaZ C-terminal domain-containing protein [Solihabitans fulvus]KAA2261081.1 acyl dehydratase [Solihabitans fulvus]